MGSSRAWSGEAPSGVWVSGPPRWVCGGATRGDLTQAGHSAGGTRTLGRPPSGNQNAASVGENAKELEPSALSAGTKNAATTVENSPAVPQETELRTTVWSSGPASRHVPWARRAGSRRGSCTHVSTAALSMAATGWKQAKCPSRDGGQTTHCPSLWQKDPSTIKKPGTLTPARPKGTLRTSCSGREAHHSRTDTIQSHRCPRVSHGCPTGVHICHKDVPLMSHECEAWCHPSVETQLLGGSGAGEGGGQFGKAD